MLTDTVYTLEEVAEHLRVPVEAVKREIAAGRLEAFAVDGNIRVGESDLTAYKRKARANIAPTGLPGDKNDQRHPALELKPAPDFVHKWPDEKVEQFTEVHEGPTSYAGRNYQVKLGFTVRESAGQARRRCVVFVNRYPTVEFVAANDAGGDGLLASIIKDRARKQVPVGTPLPPEYLGLPVGAYREVVDGPSASNGAAVICNSRDHATMVKHALIRYRYREDRT